jgi:cytochrome c oxidase subunit 2
VSDVAARFEQRWGMLVGAIIVLLLAVIIFTAVHWSSMPPSRVEVIDATTLHRGGEFVEDNLGTGLEGDRVVVRVLAEQYAFQPSCIVVPEGTPVTFRVTSSDVVHGFQIFGTNVNTMVVPGYVSTFVARLDGVGERTMPCHEFCGVGHAAMWAKVRVVPRAELDALLRERKRVSCV